MKKLLLLAALLALPSMVFAQGYIAFQNYSSPTDTRIQTNDLAGHVGVMSGTAQWTIGLYLAPAGTTDPLSSSWSLVQTSTNRSGGFAGLFTAYNPLQLPNGYGVGITFATQVRAWNNSSPTYDGAAWQGHSGIGSITPAGVTGPFPDVFGSGVDQLGSFQISPIPEPSTIALGLLGLGAVALLRRRQK